MDQGGYLISIGLNKKHMTVGQKAVLANNYSAILSKKRESEAGKKANEVRWHSNNSSDEQTVSTSDEEQDRSRKIASERWKVSEWKVRIAHEIEKTAPEVYEKLGSGDLQMHEAKIIAQLPEDKREIALEKKLETKKDIRSIV